MLVVDPVKRATIAEIRQMPFFLENLPRYLEALPSAPAAEQYPVDDLNTLLLLNEGVANPKQVAEAKGLVWTEDLGIIDAPIIAELLQKVNTYTEPMIWEMLQSPGDNQVKVAYQLVRDHKRIQRDSMYGFDEDDQTVMEDFLASSPPAWNAEIPQHKPPAQEDEGEVDIEEVDPEIQDIPNSHFDVLNSSLPTRAIRE
jgi:carbon catabolite-derepressing protein kinase